MDESGAGVVMLPSSKFWPSEPGGPRSAPARSCDREAEAEAGVDGAILVARSARVGGERNQLIR